MKQQVLTQVRYSIITQMFDIFFHLAFSDLAANLLAVVVYMGSRLEQVLWMFCVIVLFCNSHTKDLLSA